MNKNTINIKALNQEFSIHKVGTLEKIPSSIWALEFVSVSKSPSEVSIVCPSGFALNTSNTSDGWRCFKIEGILDFSLVGIIAKISKLLADNAIPLFAISTFDTDYFLVKKDFFLQVKGLFQKHKDFDFLS